MVFVPHHRLTFFGDFVNNAGDPLEHWSNTLCFGTPDGTVITDNSVLADVLDAALARWGEWFQSSAAFFNSHIVTRGAKLARIDASGHDGGSTQTLYEDQPGDVVAAGAAPPQVCIAVTLETGERGPSKRGRFYMPFPGNVSVDTWQLADGDVTGLLTAVRTMLQSLNAAGTGVTIDWGGLIVASRKGFNTPVTQVWMGHTFDTQRRRRRSLKELYEKQDM